MPSSRSLNGPLQVVGKDVGRIVPLVSADGLWHAHRVQTSRKTVCVEAESIAVRGTGGDEMLRCLIGHQEILGT